MRVQKMLKKTNTPQKLLFKGVEFQKIKNKTYTYATYYDKQEGVYKVFSLCTKVDS